MWKTLLETGWSEEFNVFCSYDYLSKEYRKIYPKIQTREDERYFDLLAFCVDGHADKAREIIDYDANIVNKIFDDRQHLPLLYAISFNRYEIVNILIRYTNIWTNTYKCQEILIDEAISYYILGKYNNIGYKKPEPYNIKIIVDLLERAPVGVYTAENIKNYLIDHFGNEYIFLVVEFLVKNAFFTYRDFSDFEVLTEEQHNILRYY